MCTAYELNYKKIINALGNTQEAKNFANEVRRMLWFDKASLKYREGYAREATPQHNILKDILKRFDPLLDVLQPLRQHKNNPLKCVDFPTASLIQTSLWQINRENFMFRNTRSAINEHTDPTNLADALKNLGDVFNNVTDEVQSNREISTSLELETYEAVPANYPTTLIDSIGELRDAVAHAADRVKPKRGNSTQRKSETIRKSKLAQYFVQSYWMCLKEYPPITFSTNAHSVAPTYKVYDIFVDLLRAADLLGEDDDCEHYYKDAINNHMDTYGKIHDVMSRLEQSGATKGKA